MVLIIINYKHADWGLITWNIFSQLITLNLQVNGLDRNHHSHHPILILLQSHQNKKKLPEQQTCQIFGDQSWTFAVSRWEPRHHQIVTYYPSLVLFLFRVGNCWVTMALICWLLWFSCSSLFSTFLLPLFSL